MFPFPPPQFTIPCMHYFCHCPFPWVISSVDIVQWACHAMCFLGSAGLDNTSVLYTDYLISGPLKPPSLSMRENEDRTISVSIKIHSLKFWVLLWATIFFFPPIPSIAPPKAILMTPIYIVLEWMYQQPRKELHSNPPPTGYHRAKYSLFTILYNR